MPFVQIHTSRVVSPAVRRSLGFALAKTYAEHMQTNHRIVNVGFTLYPPGDLARYDASAEEPSEMTIVTCDVRAGRTAEAQERLGRAITVACSRELGAPAAQIAVYLSEHDAHQIYRDGGRAPDWSAAEGVAPPAT